MFAKLEKWEETIDLDGDIHKNRAINMDLVLSTSRGGGGGCFSIGFMRAVGGDSWFFHDEARRDEVFEKLTMIL